MNDIAAPREGASADEFWLTARLTAGFLLDMIAIARCADGDPLDTLLLGAIIQANVAELIHDADLRVDFARSDEVPSDAMRRPVSMSAIAASLNLPPETVRRRIVAMSRDGWCRFVEGGVIVPTEVLSRPEYYVAAFKSYERQRAFYYELRAGGLLPDLPPAAADLSAGVFPVRTVARLTGAYMLRLAETLGLVGHMVDGLLLVEIFRSNLDGRPAGLAPDDPASEPLRTPIPGAQLARKLGLPDETVRRRMAALIHRGACARVRGGLIIPARVLTLPPVRAGLIGAEAQLRRHFAALARLGVLAVWDSLPANA